MAGLSSKMTLLIRIMSIVLVATSSAASLAADFTIVALFPGKAMLETGDKRIILKAGVEKNGILLISTDPYKQTAVLEIDGKSDSYTIGRHIGGGYARPKVTEVRVSLDKHGSFQKNGQINGYGVNFLLDTGATSIAMNENLANSLGLNFIDERRKVLVSTAAGQREAYRVNLEKVSIGGITLHDIHGMVLLGDSPEITLLGMSFLGKLEIEQREKLMILRKKF